MAVLSFAVQYSVDSGIILFRGFCSLGSVLVERIWVHLLTNVASHLPLAFLNGVAYPESAIAHVVVSYSSLSFWQGHTQEFLAFVDKVVTFTESAP